MLGQIRNNCNQHLPHENGQPELPLIILDSLSDVESQMDCMFSLSLQTELVYLS